MATPEEVEKLKVKFLKDIAESLQEIAQSLKATNHYLEDISNKGNPNPYSRSKHGY